MSWQEVVWWGGITACGIAIAIGLVQIGRRNIGTGVILIGWNLANLALILHARP